jgi:hypothetical protein
LYAEHVLDEIERLKKGNSLTWAVQNAATLLGPLAFGPKALVPQKLTEALTSLPVFIVEDDSSRRATSLNEIVASGDFWTVDCQLVGSSETLIKEVASDARLSSVMRALNDTQMTLPKGTILCNFQPESIVGEALVAVYEPV